MLVITLRLVVGSGRVTTTAHTGADTGLFEDFTAGGITDVYRQLQVQGLLSTLGIELDHMGMYLAVDQGLRHALTGRTETNDQNISTAGTITVGGGR